MPFDPAKLAALQARPGVQKAGGARRKQVVEKKNTVVEDKKLTAALARLNCKDIPAIEEVNMYNDNGTVIQFKNPKVKVASGASAYVVSGTSETKSTFITSMKWELCVSIVYLRLITLVSCVFRFMLSPATPPPILSIFRRWRSPPRLQQPRP